MKDGDRTIEQEYNRLAHEVMDAFWNCKEHNPVWDRGGYQLPDIDKLVDFAGRMGLLQDIFLGMCRHLVYRETFLTREN